MRRWLTWASSTLLVFGGTIVAHTFAYRLAYPQATVRLQMLSQSGHGYWEYVPLLFGALAAVVFATFASDVLDVLRGRAVRAMPAAAFAFLPPVAYTVQEFTERLLHAGGFPWWMVLEPTYRYGLLLQLPFSVLAFVVARLLLRVARKVAAVIAPTPRVAPYFGTGGLDRPPTSSNRPRLRQAALGWTLRGPPVVGSFS